MTGWLQGIGDVGREAHRHQPSQETSHLQLACLSESILFNTSVWSFRIISDKEIKTS